MHLDNRKMKIIELVVDSYIKFGEPVGSKKISQLLENTISSATIRNEMATLYELGFLEQPYTSAGRVPSQLAYRLYIDKIMKKKPLPDNQLNEVDSWFNIKNPDHTTLIKNSGKILSQITNCMAVLSSMVFESLTITKIEVIEVANKTLAVVLITSSGIVKSSICKVEFEVNKNTLGFIYQFVNNIFADKSVDEITRHYINSLVSKLNGYTIFLTSILYNIYQMCDGLHTSNFYIDGQTNLLAYRELDGMVTDIIKIFNNEHEIGSIIKECENDLKELGVAKVKLGRELKKAELSKVGLIIAKYNIGNIGSGNILIIGPDRLNYSGLIPWVEYFSQILSLALAEILEII